MIKTPFIASLIALIVSGPVLAQQSETLGWGRLFSNDAIGDGHDRWLTGSYAVSLLRGPQWQGSLPSVPGRILEFRLRADTIAPVDLLNPVANDRRYAGLLGLGVQTHFDWQGFDTTLGGELVFSGPQTGIGHFQSLTHQMLGMDAPQVLDDQIENAVYPTVSAEMSRGLALTDTLSFRPFVAAEAGIETLVRAGGDLMVGNFDTGALMLRDTTTGQRYRGVEGEASGALGLTIGGDIAHVFDSALFPDGGVDMSDTRTRLRAGLRWQGTKASVFYGLTYVGPEFEQQPEGQIIGSLNLNLRF